MFYGILISNNFISFIRTCCIKAFGTEYKVQVREIMVKVCRNVEKQVSVCML